MQDSDVLNCDRKRIRCSTSQWTWLTWQQTPFRLISKATQPRKNKSLGLFFLSFTTIKTLHEETRYLRLICTLKINWLSFSSWPQFWHKNPLSLSIMASFGSIEEIISRWATHSLSPSLGHSLPYSLTHSLSISHAHVHQPLALFKQLFGVTQVGTS